MPTISPMSTVSVFPTNQAEAAQAHAETIATRFQVVIHMSDNTAHHYCRVARPTQFTALAIDRLQGKGDGVTIEWISVIAEIMDNDPALS